MISGGIFNQIDDYGLTVTRRCELLGINRWEAYPQPRKVNREKIEREEEIMRRIDYWHTLFPYFGARKLLQMLKKDGYTMGLKKLRTLMFIMAIYAIYPKQNLSLANKEHKKYPYLLRNKLIQFPNQVWALDITFIAMKHGFMYLTAIIDWHSRYIVGYELSDTLETVHVTNALKKAIDQYGIPSIVNSDQGSQMTSEEYINLLKSYGISISMDGKGRWVDNVIIERWFRSLKTEMLYINEYNSPRELRTAIDGYVNDYNKVRPHQTFDYATPAEIYFETFASKQIA